MVVPSYSMSEMVGHKYMQAWEPEDGGSLCHEHPTVAVYNQARDWMVVIPHAGGCLLCERQHLCGLDLCGLCGVEEDD
jgi:hypothetical protein